MKQFYKNINEYIKIIKLFKIIDEYEKGNLSGEELKNIYKTIKITGLKNKFIFFSYIYN